jgi:hypothetical protein
MTYDRDYFFDHVRQAPFDGELTQRQVDGMEYLLDTWEEFFASEAGEQSTPWLAYCLATAFHETAQKMVPLEEYGRGEGHDYGEPTGKYGQRYYGRGHVQLTWEDNYKKGEEILKQRYREDVPLHQYPHRMLEDEPSALILFDGSVFGWFTGVGLPDFFSEGKEDPVGARQIINGHDQDELIAGYYYAFREALKPVETPISGLRSAMGLGGS